MKEKKAYRVTIELANDEFIVSASTKAEARQKAIARLDRKKASSYIRKSWAANLPPKRNGNEKRKWLVISISSAETLKPFQKR